MKPSYKVNNAKYFKTYRNKNIDKIRKRDQDRKQFSREYLKCRDTEKYEEQKRKDRELKRLANERKEKETSATSRDHNQESTSTPSSAFKRKQTKFLSLKNADKALRNSPHKQNEIVKSFAKKYDICIQLQEPTLKGSKPTSITEEGEQCIVSIYQVLCGTLQKKYERFHKALAVSYFPQKKFFSFFIFFLFHAKEIIGSFLYHVECYTGKGFFHFFFAFFFLQKK